jgi:hypothetical protein
LLASLRRSLARSCETLAPGEGTMRTVSNHSRFDEARVSAFLHGRWRTRGGRRSKHSFLLLNKNRHTPDGSGSIGTVFLASRANLPDGG